MPTEPIRETVLGLDMSGRVAISTTVAASPTTNAEVVIATVTIPQNIASVLGVIVVGWCAFTVGTAGVSARLQVKQTDASGTGKGDTGATTATAATLVTRGVLGFDTGPTLPGQVYALTLTIGSANAGSTVSAVRLIAVTV